MLFQKDFLIGLGDFTTQLGQSMPRLALAIVVFIIGIISIHFLARLFARLIDYLRISIGLKEILVILMRAAMWVLLAIGILQVLGLSNIALALGGFLAAISIGISQGFTQTVSDLVAGIQLANDQDFRIGDKVAVGDVAMRVTGYIIEMDTKKTRIIDNKGDLHIVPNSLVDKNEWTLLERDEITIAHLGRNDIIKVISHKLKGKAK